MPIEVFNAGHLERYCPKYGSSRSCTSIGLSTPELWGLGEFRRVLLNPSRTLSFNGNDIELQVVGNEARLVRTRGISLAELDAK